MKENDILKKIDNLLIIPFIIFVIILFIRVSVIVDFGDYNAAGVIIILTYIGCYILGFFVIAYLFIFNCIEEALEKHLSKNFNKNKFGKLSNGFAELLMRCKHHVIRIIIVGIYILCIIDHYNGLDIEFGILDIILPILSILTLYYTIITIICSKNFKDFLIIFSLIILYMGSCIYLCVYNLFYKNDTKAINVGANKQYQQSNEHYYDINDYNVNDYDIGDYIRTEQKKCNIKGNISIKNGKKIYHMPGCSHYNETKINTDYGEKWFCSEQEAQKAGRRKCIDF